MGVFLGFGCGEVVLFMGFGWVGDLMVWRVWDSLCVGVEGG